MDQDVKTGLIRLVATGVVVGMSRTVSVHVFEVIGVVLVIAAIWALELPKKPAG